MRRFRWKDVKKGRVGVKVEWTVWSSSQYYKQFLLTVAADSREILGLQGHLVDVSTSFVVQIANKVLVPGYGVLMFVAVSKMKRKLVHV
ncbi:hypothetical protein Bca4012_017446 [Brassica carinata]|uniref:Uncharacterized protein n=1 Tax=Brassica carinata TaxID=52824 RepID=A0A8X8BC25_BRACI|nr:hypothetical protein Bca52824_004114 [Brassica carinata]